MEQYDKLFENFDKRYTQLDGKVDTLRTELTSTLSELAKSINSLTITITRMNTEQQTRRRECEDHFDVRYTLKSEFRNQFYDERKEEDSRKHGIVSYIRNWAWILQTAVTAAVGYIGWVVARASGYLGG